jgi:protein SSD1
VLQYIADTTDEPAIKAIVSKPSSTLPESSGQVAKSIQYQKSADPTPPAFDKSSLREPASGHKIQDVKELSDVPVLVCADTSKSPPVLMVYAVNPFAV